MDTVSRASHERINFVLNKRWPEADIGTEVGYRPVIGDLDEPDRWIRTASGWEPVTYIKTVQRIQMIGHSER